ncbi:MAG: hypothetical protein HYV28_14340 [Ignavibacteriales bacterium]|nr:hypothetical protein [Ignavibacteriales bacterium]
MRKSLTLILAIMLFSNVYSQGKFTGYMFMDYFYNAARDTSIAIMKNVANGGAKELNGFNIRRAYLTYDNDINCCFTSRFRLEMYDKENLTDNRLGVFVKDAYVKWKGYLPGHDVTIGIQPTPAYEVSEKAWGYRSIEKTIMDLRGIVSSRDFGISFAGRFDEAGDYNYSFMYANGSGQRLETNKYKRYYAHFQVKPIKNFQATLYADMSTKSPITDPNSKTTPKATIGNNTTTFAAFAGYAVKDQFSIGFEWFYQSLSNGIKKGTAVPYDMSNLVATGYTLYASYNFTKTMAAVARYDYFDPATDSDVLFKGDSRNYFMLGGEYKLDKNLSVIPNVLLETYESVPNGGRSYKSSITPRVTIFYNFL